MSPNISHKRKRTIGWFCTYTPEEILLASGLDTRRILGKIGNSANADNYLHPNLCAYVRACFGALLDGENEELAGIVGVDSCDAMRRLFDACSYFLPTSFFHILALPHRCDENAARFYFSELTKLRDALSTLVGSPITEELLLESIALMNEMRALLQELEVAQRNYSPLPSSEYYRIILQSMTQPKRKFAEFLRSRLNELKEKQPLNPRGVKLLLSGGILDDIWIIEAIERAGGHVVADDLCCGNRYFSGLVESGGNPLQRIAERYIQRRPCARMCAVEDRVSHLLELVRDTGARAVIYYAIKFCDPHMLDWVMINQELQRAGIPALRFEADYSAANREQLKTRLEAFLEMITGGC